MINPLNMCTYGQEQQLKSMQEQNQQLTASDSEKDHSSSRRFQKNQSKSWWIAFCPILMLTIAIVSSLYVQVQLNELTILRNSEVESLRLENNRILLQIDQLRKNIDENHRPGEKSEQSQVSQLNPTANQQRELTDALITQILSQKRFKVTRLRQKVSEMQAKSISQLFIQISKIEQWPMSLHGISLISELSFKASTLTNTVRHIGSGYGTFCTQKSLTGVSSFTIDVRSLKSGSLHWGVGSREACMGNYWMKPAFQNYGLKQSMYYEGGGMQQIEEGKELEGVGEVHLRYDEAGKQVAWMIGNRRIVERPLSAKLEGMPVYLMLILEQKQDVVGLTFSDGM